MDPYGNIYMGEDVYPEDAARLDGFLRGRAESDARRKKEADEAEITRFKLGEQIAEYKRKLAEAEGAAE